MTAVVALSVLLRQARLISAFQGTQLGQQGTRSGAPLRRAFSYYANHGRHAAEVPRDPGRQVGALCQASFRAEILGFHQQPEREPSSSPGDASHG